MGQYVGLKGKEYWPSGQLIFFIPFSGPVSGQGCATLEYRLQGRKSLPDLVLHLDQAAYVVWEAKAK